MCISKSSVLCVCLNAGTAENGVKHQRLNCGCVFKLKSVTYVKPCSNPAQVFNGNGKRAALTNTALSGITGEMR